MLTITCDVCGEPGKRIPVGKDFAKEVDLCYNHYIEKRLQSERIRRRFKGEDRKLLIKCLGVAFDFITNEIDSSGVETGTVFEKGTKK